ncbi:hypothetical protein M5K25_013478 [Dendrobium thyrsiflorum]|uniref:Chromo domain-containing protein n=1 Tax=Dendrobium thyrsiflorum TaxID=117978 RepID=A0ABD0V109_DENTH
MVVACGFLVIACGGYDGGGYDEGSGLEVETIERKLLLLGGARSRDFFGVFDEDISQRFRHIFICTPEGLVIVHCSPMAFSSFVSFHIEAILSDEIISTKDGGYRRYLVQWTRKPETENTWIERDELQRLDPDLLEWYDSSRNAYSTGSSFLPPGENDEDISQRFRHISICTPEGLVIVHCSPRAFSSFVSFHSEAYASCQRGEAHLKASSKMRRKPHEKSSRHFKKTKIEQMQNKNLPEHLIADIADPHIQNLECLSIELQVSSTLRSLHSESGDRTDHNEYDVFRVNFHPFHSSTNVLSHLLLVMAENHVLSHPPGDGRTTSFLTLLVMAENHSTSFITLPVMAKNHSLLTSKFLKKIHENNKKKNLRSTWAFMDDPRMAFARAPKGFEDDELPGTAQAAPPVTKSLIAIFAKDFDAVDSDQRDFHLTSLSV